MSWVLSGLALIVVAGGFLGWATVAGWRGSRPAPRLGYAAGVVLAGWLAVQLAGNGVVVALVLLVLLTVLCRCVQAAVTS
ncbi:MAG TPA: hypothetical protein VG674_01650 [Amycolatopsis sp.]|nr:hypothetical protein [Amycolatopsis sp.]